MTLLQDAPTATGPTVGSVARSARGPLLVGGVLVLAALVLGVLSLAGTGGRLDPGSYAPGGSRAIAELLRDRDVPVDRVETVEAVLAAQSPSTTVVLLPELLVAPELEALEGLASPRLVVGATQVDLDLLGVDAEQVGAVDVEERAPACALPAAQAAGVADVGGATYSSDSDPAVGCYARGGEASLLALPSQGVVLLGDGAPLTNDKLDEQGNAALALGLLGQTNRVVWLVPDPGRPLPDGAARPLTELVADEVFAGLGWLAVVVAVLALWRARRLGRVVEEPLPVVVRAAEAVEGRSRLYRAASARGSAAESLRAATRERVARRTGLPAGAERTAVVGNAAARTGADPAVVDALLYGGAPGDDAALVRLADDLRSLEKTLSREATAP